MRQGGVCGSIHGKWEGERYSNVGEPETKLCAGGDSGLFLTLQVMDGPVVTWQLLLLET